jgi:hypothetical protein
MQTSLLVIPPGRGAAGGGAYAAVALSKIGVFAGPGAANLFDCCGARQVGENQVSLSSLSA